MAINKNFVVKNGLEVNTNLLVADSDNTRVGVATTSPDYLLHVFGGIGVTNLTVTGLSTFSGISTFQDGVFIGGISTHIGVGTFQNDVFIEGQLFNSDTTENTLGDVDTGSVQLDGGLGVAKNTTIGAGLSVLDGLTVVGLSTFVGIVTTSSDLFVGGDLFISEDLVLDTNLNILGIATIGRLHVTGIGTIDGDARVGGALTVTSSVDFNDDLDVDGRTELDITNISETLNVTGISTFASDVDIDAGLDVDGRTELDITNISETLNVTGVSTFASTVDINSDLDVDGRTELDITNIAETLNVTGISTFASDVDINASVDIQDDLVVNGALNVTGVSTFASTVDINSDLDVDGHTELDNLNVSGLSTFVGFSTFNDSVFIQSNLSVGGITTSNSYTIDGTTVITSGRELQNIASLDATTTATIESAIANAPNTFTDLKVTGITTLGIASATDFTADNVNVSLATTTNILAVTGIATAETLQVGDQGLSVVGVTTTLTLEVGVVGNTLVGITTILDEDNLGSDSDTALATQQSIKAYVDSAIAGTATTDNVSTSTLVVAGVSTFNGNVSIADSIIHTGDTDTSIRFPSAGTFTIHTQGSERLRVGGSGLVGIGTISPDTRLTVNSGTTDVVANFQSSDANAWIQFRDTTTTDTAVMVGANGDDLLLRAGSNERVRIDSSGNLGIGTQTVRALLDVDGAARFNGDVNFSGSTGSASTVFFDKSDNSLKFVDSAKAKFGDAGDLEIYHDGSNSYIDDTGTGVLLLRGNQINIDKYTGEALARFRADTNCELFHNNQSRFITDEHGVKITGIMTATGGYNLGIHSAGTEVTSPTGIITALDFVGTGNSICFKNQDTTSKVIEINIAGSGGGGGGVTEVDTNVSSTSATGVGSFAVASFRSAAVIAQIDQTGDYQVGRYLMIHDGTTVTVVEESAVSTGATMLGSFSGAIVGSNAELQVTMGNAGIATVTTKIDTVTV